MRQLEELKISDSPYPPVSKAKIEWLESIIGFKLPYSYISLLAKYNGGSPELSTYSNDAGEWDVNNFFFVEENNVLNDDPLSTEGLLWNYYHKWKGAKASLLPFARDGGGNLFYLDLDFGENAPVLFLAHDNPESEGFLIAHSFEQFIDNLHINPDYI
jgi:hypothetical protein